MLGGFLASDLSLEADRHLHRLKPEKKDLNPSPKERSSTKSDDRSCCSSRGCEVELELSHSFTPATIKDALLTAFLKRSNGENLKKILWSGSFPRRVPAKSEKAVPAESV